MAVSVHWVHKLNQLSNYEPLAVSQSWHGYRAFVAKFNAAGTGLVYSTYLGGSGGDEGNGIAVDGMGNAYITGDTVSTDFPTKNSLQSANGGAGDAFVAKIGFKAAELGSGCRATATLPQAEPEFL